MHVLNERDTVQFIIDNKVGIARYGDGEFKLIKNQKIKSQKADPLLAKHLKDILVGHNPKCMVGIPNMYNGVLAKPGTKAFTFWSNMVKRKEYYDYVDKNITYGSSFITRPDNTVGIDSPEYFDFCKGMWTGRNVVLVLGETLKFSKVDSLLDNCNIIGEVRGPLINAWSDYTRIYRECVQFPEDTCYLIRLGPTATVLAWDLGWGNRQGLDLGHFGMFANRIINANQNVDYNNSITTSEA